MMSACLLFAALVLRILGEIVDFALQQTCVRGVTFHPSSRQAGSGTTTPPSTGLPSPRSAAASSIKPPSSNPKTSSPSPATPGSRAIRKACIHIAHRDAKRLLTFDTFNLFYRDDLEQTRLAPLRAQALAAV